MYCRVILKAGQRIGPCPSTSQRHCTYSYVFIHTHIHANALYRKLYICAQVGSTFYFLLQHFNNIFISYIHIHAHNSLLMSSSLLFKSHWPRDINKYNGTKKKKKYINKYKFIFLIH